MTKKEFQLESSFFLFPMENAKKKSFKNRLIGFSKIVKKKKKRGGRFEDT
jgi:hypothetical protein